MAEPQDAVMPVLQKIQKDIADFRKSIEAKVNGVAETLVKHTEKFEEIESLLTYHLGLTSQHVHDIKALNAKFKDLTSRLAALESKS